MAGVSAKCWNSDTEPCNPVADPRAIWSHLTTCNHELIALCYELTLPSKGWTTPLPSINHISPQRTPLPFPAATHMKPSPPPPLPVSPSTSSSSNSSTFSSCDVLQVSKPKKPRRSKRAPATAIGNGGDNGKRSSAFRGVTRYAQSGELPFSIWAIPPDLGCCISSGTDGQGDSKLISGTSIAGTPSRTRREDKVRHKSLRLELTILTWCLLIHFVFGLHTILRADNFCVLPIFLSTRIPSFDLHVVPPPMLLRCLRLVYLGKPSITNPHVDVDHRKLTWTTDCVVQELMMPRRLRPAPTILRRSNIGVQKQS